MLSLLKSFFGQASNDSRMDKEIIGSMGSLDIQAAMAAHENWKIRLKAYLDGTSTENFVAEVICFDNRCDLGQWIYSTGQAALGKYPGFTALVGHHKMFHYAASNVVALAKSGKETEARNMLDGQFRSFSKSVANDLHLLHDTLTSAQNKHKKAG